MKFIRLNKLIKIVSLILRLNINKKLKYNDS
jgi:hypothetical protein